MLIKGGSSFNALVRALKQDVVTGAAPTTTASDRLMYEVDKVGLRSKHCLLMTVQRSVIQQTSQTKRCYSLHGQTTSPSECSARYGVKRCHPEL